MTKKKTQVMPFEEAMAQLDEIVKKMESNNLPLDDALKLFEEGIRLSRFCQEYLDSAQKRVEQVIADHQGQVELKPFVVTGEAIG